jgi:hypothetical protein
MADRPKLNTFSVYARFRSRRLVLQRGIPTLARAVAFAERIKDTRFHDREMVFIVDDATGEEIDDGALPASSDSRDAALQDLDRRLLALAARATADALQALRRCPHPGLAESLVYLESVAADIAETRRLLGGSPDPEPGEAVRKKARHR